VSAIFATEDTLGTNGLRLSGISVALGGQAVLRDVSVSVAPGEIVALQGPSGSGKTTLLRVAAGLVPAAGIIAVGNDIKARPALIFQHHALAARLSVLDNVLIGSLSRIGLLRTTLRLWPDAEIAYAKACLAKVGLAGFGPRRADTLSGGQRQRVAIARALAQRAGVLLADEPVASLDPESADLVMSLLRDLAHHEGLAILVSLHQPDLARIYADRSLRIADGRIVDHDAFGLLNPKA
jgi:phosphonate transport system ATP-binding protein